MSYPEELKYTGEHEWVRDNGDGTATVGITEFAQGELGDIVFVELNEADEELNQNDTFGTVEAVKTVSDLYAPIDGKILEVNEALEEEPELVNEDPYGDGWMIKMSISDTSQLEALMNSEAYQKIIA